MMTWLKKHSAAILLGLSWPLAFLAVQLLDPIPQDPTFHAFADSGHWWGIPNFWNVFTNLAFLGCGGWGLLLLLRRGRLAASIPEAIFFLGLILTGFGSTYYHFAPGNQSLVWDRLPMTIAFMAFFIAMVGHCFRCGVVRFLLPLALLVGVGSVLYWAYGEAHGRGDLRYYGVVQFLPMLLIPWMLLRRPPPTLDLRWLWTMLLCYLVAKGCEYFDSAMASWLPFHLTGHAMKHLFAAATGLAFSRAGFRA